MTATFLVCLASSRYEAFGAFCKHPITFIISLVLLCPSICALASEGIRRTVPVNYMLLAIVTGCETMFVSAMTADLETYSVLHAEGALVLVTFCLWIAALNTSLSVNFLRNFVVAIFAALFL